MTGRADAGPTRRTFVVGSAGAVAGASVLKGPRRAASTPVPAPSMTTTSRTPRILGAHAAVLGDGMASPVPRVEKMQVSVICTEPCRVKVQAWTTDAPATKHTSPWLPTAVGADASNPVNVAKFFLPAGVGAREHTWRWQVWTGPVGTAPDAPLAAAFYTDGVVRTVPLRPAAGRPSKFSVAVGSCSQVAQFGEPDRPVTTVARMSTRAGITQFVHMGDETYVDTWDKWLQDSPAHGYTKFAGALRKHYHALDLLKAYDRMPTRMVGDDHDDGPDNCYAANTYAFARRAISDVAAGTTFDASSWPDGPKTYDTWIEGDVQFFLLDCRLYRDTPGSRPNAFLGAPYDSQIGATQRTWLKNQLAASTARLKLIFAPRAFKEFWAGAEQQEILDWITGYKQGVAHVSGAVVLATGDMHNAAVWKLSATRPVYELLCGPLANTGLHTTTALSPWQVRWGYSGLFFNTATGTPGKAISNSIGQIDVDTTGAGAVTLRLFNESTQEYSLRVPI